MRFFILLTEMKRKYALYVIVHSFPNEEIKNTVAIHATLPLKADDIEPEKALQYKTCSLSCGKTHFSSYHNVHLEHSVK
jgi:hypothetical protein